MTTTEEMFEVFDADGSLLGRERRSEVHRRGLWHKAVNVLLFSSDGRLYLQRRAANKDVWPDAWDVSVGEHLKPGESAIDGAHRGLEEELGVSGVLLTALGEITSARIDIPALDLHDYEFQQSFRGTYDGAMRPDPREVAEIRLMDRDSLIAAIALTPERYTPWLKERLTRLGWS